MADQLKVAITNGKLSFFLALLAVAGFFWQVATTVNGQEFRTAALERKISALEAKQVEDSKEVSRMNEKFLERLDSINDKITELAIAIKGGEKPKL